MPLQLKNIQDDGSLVGTTYRNSTHYAVTQRLTLKLEDVELWKYELYLVRAERDDKLRPSDILDHIGELKFRVSEGKRKRAAVYWSEIDVNFRGTGLGKFFYKMAINDLLERGFVVVESDSSRSPEAERLWKSLSKEAPERVIDPRSEYDKFEVRRFLRRPEIRVRRHRRLK